MSARQGVEIQARHIRRKDFGELTTMQLAWRKGLTEILRDTDLQRSWLARP